MYRHSGSMTRSRQGFTLVELLVATALSIVVMTVLSVAFQTGIDTLSNLRSVVGMAEQLRAAETVIRRDLSDAHLESALGNRVRISSLTLPQTPGVRKGFFRIHQQRPLYEGVEPNGPISYRGEGDYLHFTIKLPGRNAGEVLAVRGMPSLIFPPPPDSPQSLSDMIDSTLTGTQFASRWAEVAIFLTPQVGVLTTNDPSTATASLQMYTLRHRTRLLAPEREVRFNPAANPADNPVLYPEISSSVVNAVDPPARTYRVNTPENVVDPNFRMGGKYDADRWYGQPAATANTFVPIPPQPIPINSADWGTDILLNNIISMQIQPIYDYNPSVLSTLSATQQAAAKPGLGGEPVSFMPRDLPEPRGVPSASPVPSPAPPFFPRIYDTSTGHQGDVVSRVPNALGDLSQNAPLVQDFRAVLSGAPFPALRVKSVILQLRVYDIKNRQSRQMTIVVDM